ncbi:hypothetical protein CCACVL1_11940 [Corchorus capsularis]|uniref:Uncharacterized protein n=1 Tax=Corchorus capsularis TaxID=210143 RepID=A0A1R3IIR9_COCAP|nr:hypothetical protein CCACVL1_11940 [Corchorus capsularis]
MKHIADECRLAGAPIDDDDLVLHILRGLGSEYRELTTTSIYELGSFDLYAI